MRKVFTTASVILLGIASALAAVPENQDPASASPVGWKPSGHELKDAPPLKTGARRLRTVPTRAQIFGSDSVRGQSETSPSVSPAPQAHKASGDGGADETGRKAQALLIFSDTKKATNSIIELPLTPGTVNYFDVVADNVPPMPYKSYGEAVVNAVEFDGLFMASTFCDMLYSQTNSVYTVSDWEHQYNYDYRAADLETTALAYNPADGLCYGVFQGTNPSSGNEEWFFGKWVDPSSYTRPEVISWLGSDTLWYGMAISPEGVIYAIDGECNLVTLDSQTGEVKLIGSTGLQNQYKTSACYDAENGRILFATSLDYGSSFNAIDPTTGRATMLYAMPDGEQIVGLFIPAAPVPDKAPAAAVNLKADFELGSLTGNICFDVPSTYHDGTPASGTVTYEVRLNGTASGTGTASYGTTVSVPVTLTESLSGLVTVKLSNEYGSTPLTRATLFCGTPTPRPPYYTGNVTYDGTAGCFNLSWSPNRDISGTTGGSVVNADLTYELTRYPDGKVITTEPGATTLSDPYVFPDDDFRIVYYELRSVYHGAKSNPARSNTLSFGTINPPYVNEMMNSTGAAAFSYLPTASDNLQWSYIGAVTEQEKQHGWMNHGAANSATPMDSYLVLNGMRLQKGKVYTLAFTAACTNTSWRNERMAVYLGDKVTESGLRKQTLIEPTLVYSRREENGERHTCNFSVEEDGVYYLSFHHCSDPNLRYLYIGDISISAPIDGAVPSEVTGLDVKAAAGGKLSATLSFTMPAKSVDGKPLEEPAHVRIIRNEEQIADMLPSGTTCIYTDDKAANGINNYVVIPYNSKGEGLKSGVNVFVGVGKPRNPQPRAWYGTDDGTAIISWQPSDSDEFGTALDASNVRYEIQRVTEENGKTVRTVIADGITGLTYDDHFCAPEAEQTAVSWYVRAVTDGGNSQWVGTRHLGLGKPDTAPWKESFTDGKVHHNWFTAGQDVRWGPITDEVYDDAKSVDADNGLMVCVASKAGSATLLYSGPVVIPTDMERPELSFYFFNQDKYQGVAVKNFIELAIMDENGQTHVKKAVCNGPWGWERMAWNMDEYRGKKIQVGVYAECIDRPSILLDAFRIAPRYDNDIDMVTLAGPSEIEAGTDAVFTVTYENLGLNDIPAGYKVRLFRGGELIAEKDGPAVKADAKATVTFTAATNPTMNSPLFFKAAVALDCDGNPSNNESNTLTLELVKNTGYPVPRNLTADGSDTAVALKWESPCRHR